VKQQKTVPKQEEKKVEPKPAEVHANKSEEK